MSRDAAGVPRDLVRGLDLEVERVMVPDDFGVVLRERETLLRSTLDFSVKFARVSDLHASRTPKESWRVDHSRWSVVA